MNNLIKFFILLLNLSLVSFGTSAGVAQKTILNVAHEHLANELLIRFVPGMDMTDMEATAQSILGSVHIKQFMASPSLAISKQHVANKKMTQWCLLILPKGSDLEKSRKLLASHSDVEAVEYNYIVNTVQTPDDTRFSELWGLNNIGQSGGTPGSDIKATHAWDLHTGDPNVVVAVIDTGVDYTHPDLMENMWRNFNEIPDNNIDDDNNGYVDDIYGYDFVNNDNDPMDDYGHGTHVAGTIAAKGNNALGITGVAWQAKIMALKFLNEYGRGTVADAINAILYATQMNARLSNNSWSGTRFSLALKDTIALADEAGSLFVAAAGNAGANSDVSPSYPAAYDLPNIISVAATDNNDNRARFSNYGAVSVDLGAPGVQILSTVPKTGGFCCSNSSGYMYLEGTSMASPHVAGAAVLMFSAFPQMSHKQVKERLLNSVDIVPALENNTVSGGRLNIARAMDNNDFTAPGMITDLAISITGTDFIRLTWHATGDDGNQGQANRYDIRYSDSLINSSNFNSADVVLNKMIPAPAGTIENFSVTGLQINSGYYFAIKAIDKAGNISDISNVVTSRTEEILFPDFEITHVSGPNQSSLGSTVSVSTTVCNNSTTMTPDMLVGIYLSADNDVTITDRRIGEHLLPTLDPGQCNNGLTAVEIFADLAPGDYFLGAIVDEHNMVTELREDNNAAVGNIITLANYVDLFVTNISGTESVVPGGIIRATDTVCNLGSQTSSSSFSALYVSTDPDITIDDMRISTHRVGTLGKGACATGEYWGRLPVSNFGTYFIGSIADYRNEINEGDEGNNTPAPLVLNVIDGQADLVVKSVEGPVNAVQGEIISIVVDICNQGIRQSGDFNYELYISSDTEITPSDTLISTFRGFLYNEHCKTDQSITATIPLNLISDTYYLGVIVDGENVVSESSEDNNSLAGNVISITAPSVDLFASNITGPAFAKAGETFSLSGLICNIGAGAIPSQLGMIYLSTDSNITTNDLAVGWLSNPAGETQCSNNYVSRVYLPTNIAKGEYYWGVILDTFNWVSESDEFNNAAAGNVVTVTAP